MKTLGKFIIVVMVCLISGVTIGTIATEYNETEIILTSEDNITRATGIVHGYIEDFGMYHIRIGTTTYPVSGINKDTIEKYIGKDITINLMKVSNNQYDYLGVDNPIIEETIVMSMNESDEMDLEFINWFEGSLYHESLFKISKDDVIMELL